MSDILSSSRKSQCDTVGDVLLRHRIARPPTFNGHVFKRLLCLCIHLQVKRISTARSPVFYYRCLHNLKWPYKPGHAVRPPVEI